MSGGVTLLRVSEGGKVLYLNDSKSTGHYGLTGMRRAESSYEAFGKRRYIPFRGGNRSTGDLRITTNGSTLGSAPRLPPKDVNRMKKPAPSIPTITTPTASVDTIPEEDITIPTDGCLYNFKADEIATFFRYMRIEDRLINHWQRRGLDGKKFSKLSNNELDSCGVNNPIMRFFRDKSAKKTNKGRMNFLL